MDDLGRLMDKVLGPKTAEICRREFPWLWQCDCTCHVVIQPGLVPCPECKHSSRSVAEHPTSYLPPPAATNPIPNAE